MKKATSQNAKAAELRRRAEERLKAKPPEADSSRTDDETQRLLHELQVHQVELEMQNEELRRARDDLETSLEKYTDLYDFAPVGYFTIDRNGTIRAVNLTGATLLGVVRSRLLGRRFGQLVAATDRSAFTAMLGTVFTSGDKETCDVVLLNGGNPPLAVQIEAVAAASGLECRVAVIDISKRRQLEEKLEMLHTDLAARATDLEAANIELETFNYSVTHDLRRPLTVINSYCQVLQELSVNILDDECKGYIKEMYEGTLHMNQIIDSQLKFSSVSRVELRHEKVNLSELAELVVMGLKVTEPERRVTLRVAAGISCNGDANLWRIVLENLIGNAWKFTGSREETLIEFGMTEVEGQPACYLRDNGPGFDMEFADKLFVPFQRFAGTGVEGEGIGLATVDRIVRRHGGRIWAESKPGEGATFFFTLE